MDIGGEVLPRSYVNATLECENLNEAETILDSAYQDFHKLELQWIGRRFGETWREKEDQIQMNADRFDELIEEDRREYLEMLSRETAMLSL